MFVTESLFTLTPATAAQSAIPAKAAKPQKIGLLGGSFNPPHHAHLALANAAWEQLNLDRVDLLPAGQPWQKTNDASIALASPAHRLSMCQAAIQGHDHLGVEPCETLRIGNTYTVDTLAYLTQQHPDHQYTLLIGADQARQFDTWHRWQQLLTMCRIAVVARNGLAPTFPHAVAAACKHVDSVQLPAFSQSSSAIRAAVMAGQSITAHVPASVERYIVEHSLYKHFV